MRKTIPLSERFWAKVNKTDTCWLWSAAQTSTGYGIFCEERAGKQKMWKAHRLAYVLTTGESIDGLVLDHICHTPLCVNPAHLRPSTHKQNLENRASLNSNNKSGVRGVCWSDRYQKWVAQLKHHGQPYYLGRYETKDEAAAVVLAKRLELYTHNDADRDAA